MVAELSGIVVPAWLLIRSRRAATRVLLSLEATMSVNAGTAGRVGRLVAAAAAVCAVPVLYARWGRPRLLTWGATADEVSRSYPGDELIPRASGGVFTMAATLPAPPEKVWPWLVQMGGDRAGFYSWDRLDHGGKPSADRIVPQWQSLQTGQRLNAEPAGQNWMTVEVAEPGRTLVLRENFELPSGHSFDPQSGPKSRVYLDGIWGFYLRPAPGGQTRLVAHTRGRTSRQPFMAAFSVLLGEPLHFIMQTRQFHGLRTRVGAGPHRGTPSEGEVPL